MCNWVENSVSGGSVGIEINDDIGHYFQTKKMFEARRSYVSYFVQYYGGYALYFN